MTDTSDLFTLALKAKIPVIGVETDDLLNATTVLQLVAKRKVQPLPQLKTPTLNPELLYWTEDLEIITVDKYRRISDVGAQAVVINPGKTSPLVFATGQLPTPHRLLAGYLSEFVGEDRIEQVSAAVAGLSLKTASEIIQVTMARVGSAIPAEIRKTRQMLGQAVQGFQVLDPQFDFYIMPDRLNDWLKLNEPFFLDENAPRQLVPRGLLLSGRPGVGKSMFSKVIASHWKVPLVRLDVPASLNRMLGESESRISRSLASVEQYAPCILLIDEVEKLFGNDEEGGTTARILSQLLWWLQEHRSKVLTVMTTNRYKQIPPELYREGRIDAVIEIPALNPADARELAEKVFSTVLKCPPTKEQKAKMAEDVASKQEWAHAELTQWVYLLIKREGWHVKQNKLAFA